MELNSSWREEDRDLAVSGIGIIGIDGIRTAEIDGIGGVVEVAGDIGEETVSSRIVAGIVIVTAVLPRDGG